MLFYRNIIWLGDLNYRINLSYEKAHELIARKEWKKLAEKDQVRLLNIDNFNKGSSQDHEFTLISC